MSTPSTDAPPAWLEAAAKLDALLGERAPASAAKKPLTADEDEPEEPADEQDSADEEEVEEPVAEHEPPPEAKPRTRIAAPAVVVPKPAPTEEVELAWRGYSPLDLLPSTAVFALVTCGTILALRPLLPAWVMREAIDAPLAAVWLLQAVRAMYRLLAYDYRLTSRRLFRSRGPLYPRETPLDLATVVRAEVRQTRIGRLIGVGTVRLIPEDATPTRPAVELDGIRRPQALAGRIQEAATTARGANVTTARATIPAERG
jgi:hypothetical protein